MTALGYYNGEYGALEEMKIPMNDRASYFGDGVYDAGPCRNYNIFAVDEHIDRFFRNAARLEIEMPVTKNGLRELLDELVLKLDDGEQFVYYQVTRGTGIRNHVFTEGPGNLWITLTPQKLSDGREPLRLITKEDTRFFHCDIKTLNLIPSVMASEHARRAGCQEAVFVRPGGRVTECAHSNVHIIKDGELYTAPPDELILPGIARAHLLNMCRKLGVPVHETPFDYSELMEADEVLVTSSSNLCRFADEIDGRPVGGRAPGLLELLRSSLMAEFEAATSVSRK